MTLQSGGDCDDAYLTDSNITFTCRAGAGVSCVCSCLQYLNGVTLYSPSPEVFGQ